MMKSINAGPLLVAVLLLLTTAAAKAEPIEYALSHHCNGQIEVASAVILKADGWWQQNPQGCTVTLKSNIGPQGCNRVRLEVLDFYSECQTNTMELFDGDKESGREMADVCGSITDDDKMFLIQSDTVTLVLNTRNGPPGPDFTARLLVTALTYCYDGTYYLSCDNEFFIDPRLKCDGYNNCGDRSDESDCGNWSTTDTCVVLGSTLGGFLLVSLVIVVKRCRRRTQDMVGSTSASSKLGVARQPLPSVSIQGEINPGYNPAA